VIAMADEPLISGSLENIDRVCDEFERRYRAGESPRIEELLGEVSASDHGALVLELIALEVWFRRSAEQTPAAQEYTARFPQFEREILELFASESSQSISRGITKRSFFRSGLRSTLSWKAPTAVGRYELVSLLGQGGFGEVWKGIDTELQRSVAVKLMRADLGHTPELAELFVSEGRKLAQLRHPGVVTVFDVGQAEGRCYIVSELMDGGTLSARLKAGAFSPVDAALLIAKIGDALHHAHLHGLIHRDIKPQNILLDAAGEPKLADFGLAANEDDQLAEAPATMGTLAYMSPEVVRGASHHTDARADIYSLGVVLYQALTGRLPFVAHSAEQYREQILNREVRPPRTIDDRISPEVERICLKCLQKNLIDRYTTAADLARELRSAVEAPRAPLPPAAAASNRWWLIGAGAMLLLAVVGAAAAISGPTLIAWWSPRPALQAVPPKEEAPGLAYDETAPGFHRTMLRWNQLLDGPAPCKLVWSADDENSIFLRHPERSELVLSRTGLGLVALGRVTEPAYTLEIDLHQQQWAGRVGVFFGYHPMADMPSKVRYQTISFERYSDADIILSRALHEQQIDGPDEVGPPMSRQLSKASVPLPRSGTQLLELDVFRDTVKVRWAGLELKELSNDAFQTVQLADQTGEFGVYLHKANLIVRDARIMAKKSY
jgi:hypothetical protein